MSDYEATLEELLHAMPTPRRLSEVKPQAVSCVVAIAGFEPRCCEAARRIAWEGWKSAHSVSVVYTDSTLALFNEQHRQELNRSLCDISLGGSAHTLEYNDHILQPDFGEQLFLLLTELGVDLNDPSTHIVFDISVGSSRLLLEGLNMLLSGRSQLTILYSESRKYRPDFMEYLKYLEEKRVHAVEPQEFLTKGVESVEVLRRIPGTVADSRPAYLVLFPSFSFTRATAILEELAPSRVQWLFGIPHLVENRWRLDAQKEYHKDLADVSHRRCYVSTFDYRESLEVLERIYRKRCTDYGIYVASLGSKLQKVGQALFHLLRPEVAAVVSIPRTWDPDRFSGDDTREVYALSLGNCEILRRSLWRTRTLKL
jgi:hypothetical protein